MKTKTPIETKDYFLTQEPFSLVKIEGLDVYKTTPRIKKEAIGKYYKSTKYLSHNNNKSLFSLLYWFVKRLNFHFKYNVLKTVSTNDRSLLDFGSGNAYFVSQLKKRGLPAVAYDPFYDSVLNKTVNDEIVLKDEKSLISARFNTITMWHSLEHVFSYKDTLSLVSEILMSKGNLIVACPNYESFDANYYKKFWAGFDVPRHYWHFSPNGLIEIMSHNGFDHIKKKPMYFDAIYVSMLSEQYKQSKLWFIKGLAVGVWSNLVSLFKNNASSYVYLFKKRF
ncbi:class I SAM-dependent methyltransferase [Flavobacteriaceae bacterium]|nr:class I SAM-dependent methyltransferase [Flavobacteriaceae bacterium]